MNRPTPLARQRGAFRASGFTLIELMIAVAVVALLAAIALPSYQDSVWKGKRGEAKTAIMKALQAEERYYTNNNTYVAYSGTAPSGAFPVFSADSASNSRYTISTRAGPVAAKAANGSAITLCSTGTIVQCVVVKALVNGGGDPKCGNALYSDSIGNKGVDPAALKPAACWS